MGDCRERIRTPGDDFGCRARDLARYLQWFEQGRFRPDDAVVAGAVDILLHGLLNQG